MKEERCWVGSRAREEGSEYEDGLDLCKSMCSLLIFSGQEWFGELDLNVRSVNGKYIYIERKLINPL